MSDTPGSATPLPEWVREILRCPVTGSSLTAHTGPEGTTELVTSEAGGDGTRLAYPVRNGIPVLLEHEARGI